MLSKVCTAVRCGIEGYLVSVETDISSGLPVMNIVGLASTTVMESRQRIKSAIINSGFDYPRRKITVNLYPADLRKNGSGLDLPMAIGVLASSLCVNCDNLSRYGIVGELSLDGLVHGVRGILPIIMGFKSEGIEVAIIPEENYEEARIIEDIELIAVSSLCECVEVINGGLEGTSSNGMDLRRKLEYEVDFAEISGQENAKRAICVAAAGQHGLLMVGPPGCGKTMLARRIPTILPPMTGDEIIETAVIYSVMGERTREGLKVGERPFRSPHSSIGKAGLLGGGVIPIPGEISLANNGVLFLDEVCEFDRENIDSLRLPLEDREIVHFRGGAPYRFPCRFLLVMASNPCPCGFAGDDEHICKCSQAQIDGYRRKLSGPMIDRIDLRINMEKVSFDQISGIEAGSLDSEAMRKEVLKGIAFARKMGRMTPNGSMTDSEISKTCVLGPQEEALMSNAYESLSISPRSYNKILKVARTIADMDESERIEVRHLAEALSYRTLTDINGG